MRVLLINGSPKENGNTSLALGEVARALNAEGITTQLVSIGKQAVQGCIACGWCGRTGKCTYTDDLYWASSCSISQPPVWWCAAVAVRRPPSTA